MIKRVLIFAVVLSLLIGSFGCGAKENPQSGESGTTGTTATSSGIKDFGTVKVIRPMSYNKGKDVEKVANYIKDRSGVKIEPVYADNVFEKFNLMLAANEDVDAVNVSYEQFTTLKNNGSLMALDKYIKQYGSKIKGKLPVDLWKWYESENGECLAIPYESVDIGITIQIRNDWLKQLNLAMPTTLNKFEDVMGKFKEKFNTSPLLIGSDFDTIMGGFMLPMGYSWWKNKDGQYLPPEMHPEYKEIILKLNDWYKKGIIHPETFTANQGQLIEGNKIGAKMGWYSGTFPSTMNLRKREANAEFVYVSPLSDKYDNGYYQMLKTGGGTVVSAKSKNPAGLVKLIDWTCEDLENMIVTRIGIPGEHFNFVDKEKGIVEVITSDLNSDKFIAGTFEILDVNGYTERQKITESNMRLQWYYDFWDLVFGKKIKCYNDIDEKNFISNGLLKDSSKILNAVNTAAIEAKVKFITGGRPMSEWEDFLKEWNKMGMDKVIAEKNLMYAKKIK